VAQAVNLDLPDVEKNSPAERRIERREMHVDRRKSDLDVIEHVICGVHMSRVREPSDDPPRRAARRK
jgi:hypothetical protein